MLRIVLYHPVSRRDFFLTHDFAVVRWSKISTTEGASKLQMIIDRVENEVIAGNVQIELTSQMFALAIDTWLRSGSEDAPSQCEKLLHRLCRLYQLMQHDRLKPTTFIFNLGEKYYMIQCLG